MSDEMMEEARVEAIQQLVDDILAAVARHVSSHGTDPENAPMIIAALAMSAQKIGQDMSEPTLTRSLATTLRLANP